LTEALPGQFHAQILILCGINNLAAGDSIDMCLNHFNMLIEVVERRFGISHITVLGVLPVRDEFHDEKAARLNESVKALNQGLMKLCADRGCRFLNVSEVVSSKSGALDSKNTADGLHLNIRGYRLLAEALEKNLVREL
jgi:lysophospholipase L1-like esterase